MTVQTLRLWTNRRSCRTWSQVKGLASHSVFASGKIYVAEQRMLCLHRIDDCVQSTPETLSGGQDQPETQRKGPTKLGKCDITSTLPFWGYNSLLLLLSMRAVRCTRRIGDRILLGWRWRASWWWCCGRSIRLVGHVNPLGQIGGRILLRWRWRASLLVPSNSGHPPLTFSNMASKNSIVGHANTWDISETISKLLPAM